MAEPKIQTGEIWTVRWYGRDRRVRVICSQVETPDTWICEEIRSGEMSGPGDHLLVDAKHFLRREGQYSGGD